MPNKTINDDGADPAQEIKDQNPEGETTTSDMAEDNESTKAQDLAKAGRRDFDPNAGEE